MKLVLWVTTSAAMNRTCSPVDTTWLLLNWVSMALIDRVLGTLRMQIGTDLTAKRLVHFFALLQGGCRVSGTACSDDPTQGTFGDIPLEQ